MIRRGQETRFGSTMTATPEMLSADSMRLPPKQMRKTNQIVFFDASGAVVEGKYLKSFLNHKDLNSTSSFPVLHLGQCLFFSINIRAILSLPASCSKPQPGMKGPIPAQ